MVNMHRSGHCSNQKVSNGQIYDEVGRTVAQVTISCDSENAETVYNRYHSIFNDKDCEPLGPEQLGRRTGSCLIGHFRVLRLFSGCLGDICSCLSYDEEKKRFEIFVELKNFRLRVELNKVATLLK